jgi:RecA-family ATPase
MPSIKNTPGFPFRVTPDIHQLIDQMSTLDVTNAPLIEPALLAPFMAVGDFLNISGPRGCGKSMLAVDTVIAAAHPARDGYALGGLMRFDLGLLGPGLIAVIDGENCRPRWESMIRRRLETEGLNFADLSRPIKYMRPADIRLHERGDRAGASIRAAKALCAICVRFVVIDTLGVVWAPEDINSSAWVQDGLLPFRMACKDYGISVLLLSHTRRSSGPENDPTGPIGTSFQENQVDAQLIARPARGGSGLTLTHEKSRRSLWIKPGIKVSLTFTREFGYQPQEGWQQVWPHECPDFDSGDFEPPTSTRSKVEGFLKHAVDQTATSREIGDALDFTSRAASGHVRQLKDADLVVQIGNGRNTRWKWKSPC